MLRGVLAVARECVDLAAVRARDLGQDLRGGAEAEEAEARGVAGHSISAKSDQTRAQQRRCFGRRVIAWDRKAVAAIGHGVLRVSAVDGVAGELCVVAQILAAGSAVRANAARPREPRNAEARVRRFLDPDDLMSGNERQLRIAQLAIDDMEVGSADRAAFDTEKKLLRVRFRHRQLGELERFAGFAQDHGVHARRVLGRGEWGVGGGRKIGYGFFSR